MNESKKLKYAAAVLAACLSACDNPNGPDLTSEQEEELQDLRELTAPYVDFNRALNAGYDTKLTGCLSDPAGAMGVHYGKTALIDGAARPLAPEVLMYEPQPNGELRFVGVEYIVPLSATDEPPMLFGQMFHRNEAFQLWVLHVWLNRDNPNGLFADWNPDVSCAAAK